MAFYTCDMTEDAVAGLLLALSSEGNRVIRFETPSGACFARVFATGGRPADTIPTTSLLTRDVVATIDFFEGGPGWDAATVGHDDITDDPRAVREYALPVDAEPDLPRQAGNDTIAR